jgi:hypothetical protein
MFLWTYLVGISVSALQTYGAARTLTENVLPNNGTIHCDILTWVPQSLVIRNLPLVEQTVQRILPPEGRPLSLVDGVLTESSISGKFTFQNRSSSLMNWMPNSHGTIGTRYGRVVLYK